MSRTFGIDRERSGRIVSSRVSKVYHSSKTSFFEMVMLK